MTSPSFGIVSITRETKTLDFVKYLEHGAIMATRCKRCETVYFPPKMDCPKCLLSDLEWVKIQGNGKLVTYTIVNYGPGGFEDDTPYTLAIAELADGVQILGRLSRDIDESDIKIGMNLKVVPVKLSGNRITYEFQREVDMRPTK